MSSTKYLVILALCCSAINCKSTDSLKMKGSQVQIVTNGGLYGNGKEGFEKGHQAIKSKVDYKAMINKMNRANKVAKPEEANTIDFENYILVAIFDKVRSTGGYSMEFEKMTMEGQNLILHIKMNKPERLATSIMTQPYLLLKLPKTNKEIEVKY